jgi:hypothetical protein
MSEYRERIGAPLSSTDLKQLQAKLARARADLSRLEAEYTRASAHAYWHDYHHTDHYRGKRNAAHQSQVEASLPAQREG